MVSMFLPKKHYSKTGKTGIEKLLKSFNGPVMHGHESKKVMPITIITNTNVKNK